MPALLLEPWLLRACPANLSVRGRSVPSEGPGQTLAQGPDRCRSLVIAEAAWLSPEHPVALPKTECPWAIFLQSPVRCRLRAHRPWWRRAALCFQGLAFVNQAITY